MEGTIRWKEDLIKKAEIIMRQGGELHFKVITRQRERISECRIYPDNFTRYKTETLITD